MRPRPVPPPPVAAPLFALLALCACGGGDTAPGAPAPAGEVRGAPLRSFGARPAGDGAPDGAAPDDPAPAASAPDEELGLDYADVLPPEEAARYAWVDFMVLTDFTLPQFGLDQEPEPGGRAGAPAEVVELDGALVAIEGFMNPTAFDRGGVSEFTLVADPTFCCFGVTPALNHFIQVSLPEGERTEFYSIVPIAVYGRLQVGLEVDEGIALSFYRMTAEHVFCVY